MQHEQESLGPVEIGILGGGALSAVVWAGAQLAAFLGGGAFLDLSFGDALGALVGLPAHPGEPQLAWPASVRGGLPGTALYWLATAAVGAAVPGHCPGRRPPGQWWARVTRPSKPPRGSIDRADRSTVRSSPTHRPPTRARTIRPWPCRS